LINNKYTSLFDKKVIHIRIPEVRRKKAEGADKIGIQAFGSTGF
jgi:hypothetical protein